MAPATAADLRGGDAATNAGIARRVLGGEAGPARDAVLLNAAAALCVADGGNDIGAALARAASAVDDGRAADVLERWVAFTAGAA